jgi:hypothetical protein
MDKMIILSTLMFAAIGLDWRSRFPDGNDRQKNKGKIEAAFCGSHPSQVQKERRGWCTLPFALF